MTGSTGLKILKRLGYGLFFMVALVFWTVVGFPDEELTAATKVHLSNRLGVPVHIREVSLTGLVSFKMEGASIRLGRADAPTAEKPDAAKPKAKPGAEDTKTAKKKKKKRPYRHLDISRLTFDTGIGDAMWLGSGAYIPGDGSREFDFAGNIQGGEVTDGRFEIDQDNHVVKLAIGSLKGLMIGKAGLLKGLTGFDIRAALDANISLGFSVAKRVKGTDPHPLGRIIAAAFGKRMSFSAFDLEMTFRDTKIATPVISSRRMGTEYLTDVKVGNLRVVVKLKSLKDVPGFKGRRSLRLKDTMVLHIVSLDADGPDIAIKVDSKSTIRLRRGRPFSQSTIDLHLGIKLKKAFLEKRGKNARGEVGKHNKKIELFAKYEPTLKRSYRNGVLGIYCRGRLSKPKCGIERSRVLFDQEPSTPPKATRKRSQSKPDRARRSRRARSKAAPAPRQPSRVTRPGGPSGARKVGPRRARTVIPAPPRGPRPGSLGPRRAAPTKRGKGLARLKSVRRRPVVKVGDRSPTPAVEPGDDGDDDGDEEEPPKKGDDDDDDDDEDDDDDDDDDDEEEDE